MEVKLSVAMTTYNHQKYIAQAIEGVLMQKTNFPFELIIGDDCSTDKTLEICLNYQNIHPTIIQIIQSKQNQGLRKNNIEVWTKCKGKYIAYCEGDDFWTNPNKLQKQVDFLDSHNDFIGVFHQTQMLYDDERPSTLFTPINQKKRLNFEENIERWVVATCSLVFRNIFKSDQFKKYRDMLLSDEVFYSDRPLMAFLTKINDFYYLSETMGVWRQHENNMTRIGNLSEMSRAGGEAYKKMIFFFPENRVKLSEQVIRWYLLSFYYSFKKKEITSTFQYNLYALINIRSKLGLKNYLKCTMLVLKGKEIYQ